jgi:hypothetical protein
MRLLTMRRSLRSAVFVGLMGALGVSGATVGMAGARATPSSTSYANAVVGTIDSAASEASLPTTSQADARVAQHLQVNRRATRALAGTASAQVTGSSVSSLNGPGGGVPVSFNGTSSLDSAITNFGAEFEPPDQGLCAGNGFVLEPVNSAYRIYRPVGTTANSIAGPFNVNNLYHESPRAFTSDPRCYFDRSTNTWFAIILFIASSTSGRFGNSSSLDIAVNPSGDPTTDWTNYHIDTSDLSGNGCPCFGDQPLLGIDATNLYVSTNEFSINGPQFNGAQIYAFSKTDLVASAHSVHFAHFSNLSNSDGSVAASVQPAITNGPANAEYFMDSLDPTGNGDNRIGVWALTNQGAVALGQSPTLSRILITSEPYASPPNAVQKGSSSLLVTNDDRMQQVQFINGSLWGELSTALSIHGDTAQRSAAAWFQVQPQLSGTQVGNAAIVRQGYAAVLGKYLLYPALQADSRGNAAMVFTLSSSQDYGSAAYAALARGQSSFGDVHIVAAGTGPHDPDATRWGDYSWAQLDPVQDSVWLSTEYIPPVSSQTPDGNNNWGTEVFQLNLGGD